MGICVDIDQKRIIYLLWTTFFDARGLFLKEVKQGEAISDSMLRYTTKLLGVGRIPTDIIEFLVAHLGGD